MLRDLFHSFAISSALFFKSLFAMNVAEAIVSWMEVAEGRNGKDRSFEGQGRIQDDGCSVESL